MSEQEESKVSSNAPFHVDGLVFDTDYELLLPEWEREGFVEPGWEITSDQGAGANRVRFRVGDTTIDVTEADMEWFCIGAMAMRTWQSNKSEEQQ
ncbi:hypothetical protein [Streptomyces sp. NPDC017448]|uniref:hypothetical protein n=1 Tax=Streptomyces sp. NPDC017448 TaxID=3364996 RepID=UPI0037B0A5F6